MSIVVAVLLTACILPEKDDPFDSISEEKIETIFGEIFPFSVSVSTKASHRLENNNKLVALLASKIVNLEDFEGRKVELDGFYRKEKMRPIFWVEAIRVKDLAKDKSSINSRFENKTYSFVIPKNWENSILENGTIHFLNKKDPNRKVFLTFKVSEVTKNDKKNDPNIVIANMAGNKTSSKFDSGQTRQEINLFSNIFKNRKYTFIFNNNVDDFSLKKDFFKLLNSFVEGEENVKITREKELKKLAEKESELVKKEEGLKTPVKSTKETPEKSENIITKILGTSETEKNESELTEDKKIIDIDNDVDLPIDFENKIDEKAFIYESSHYKFAMKVPYGLWFRNFGQSEEFISQIGFATHDVNNKSDSEFFLKIIADQEPVSSFYESQENGILTIQFPRNNASYYELTGPTEYRDYMRSIQTSIENI